MVSGQAGLSYAAIPEPETVLDLPRTGFSCSSQDQPGIYADTETGCKVRIKEEGFVQKRRAKVVAARLGGQN